MENLTRKELAIAITKMRYNRGIIKNQTQREYYNRLLNGCGAITPPLKSELQLMYKIEIEKAIKLPCWIVFLCQYFIENKLRIIEISIDKLALICYNNNSKENELNGAY